MSTNVIRILVVDDDDDIRAVLSTFAEADPRFEVVGSAADGVEATALAATSRPDVVVLDDRMPRMGGFETIVHLRTICPRARIVMFSGERREDALQLGAHGSFTKDDPIVDLLDAAVDLVRQVERHAVTV